MARSFRLEGCAHWAALVGRLAPSAMPTSHNERQALERERADLPGQLAAHQAELEATPPGHKTRREMLAWQIRRIQKRMAEIEARLAKSHQASTFKGADRRRAYCGFGGSTIEPALDPTEDGAGD